MMTGRESREGPKLTYLPEEAPVIIATLDMLAAASFDTDINCSIFDVGPMVSDTGPIAAKPQTLRESRTLVAVQLL